MSKSDKNGGGGDAPSARPALLCMKLSETDTSDDEVKYRFEYIEKYYVKVFDCLPNFLFIKPENCFF